MDAPVDILISPLAPLLVVPDLNARSPLDPETPAFGVMILTDPGSTPAPELSEIVPPVWSVWSPAIKTALPPTSLLWVLPTAKRTLPDLPAVASLV